MEERGPLGLGPALLPTRGLSRAPLAPVPQPQREADHRGRASSGPAPGAAETWPRQALGRAWRGGPGPQAHHGLLVRFLDRVTADLRVAVILWRLPLQSHIETPCLCDLNVLGRARLVCRRQTLLGHHSSQHCRVRAGNTCSGGPRHPTGLGLAATFCRAAAASQGRGPGPQGMTLWVGSLALGSGSPPSSGTGNKDAQREAPGPRTNDLQDQRRLVLHALDAQSHLVGARVCVVSGSNEEDCVRGAVADVHLLALQ